MKPQETASAATPGVRLTPQQSVSLVRGAGSVALSAGAGCGKTTVLAERFLLEFAGADARPLRSVVALTFTEKAARELRQRIRARCRDMIAGGTDEQVGRWQTILRGLEAAPIGTFHEFCGRMLRRFPVESGIDPEFNVLDDSIARTLRDQAIRATLRSALAEQDLDLIELAVDYGLNQIYEALAELVASIKLEDLETWAGQDREAVLALWQEVWTSAGRPALIRRAAHAARRCRSVLEPIEACSSKLLTRRGEILPLLDEVEAGRASDSSLEELRELARVTDLRGKDVWPSDDVKEQVKKRFEAIRKAIDTIASRLRSSESLTSQEIENRARFARLALHGRKVYERFKQDRHGLDFDDLQSRFVELLRNHPEIFAATDAETETDSDLFEFILVDEFQDTDRLQSEILQRLGGAEFLNGRLFVVGDFKQSIYGFRGAEPAIFQEWRTAFPASGRRELSENFRSVPGIIHFVNALFAECFSAVDAVPSDDAQDGGAPRLNRLGPKRDAIAQGPAVTFHWVDIGERSTDPESESAASRKPKKASVRALREAEAKSLARLLRERLDEGWTIYDRKEKRSRHAGPGDVAFLFRAMTDVGPYESALAEQGFDYHTVGGAAFFAQQEIHDVINVLSIVEDPLDEVSLAGALRSPFFSLSDDGLYWLATSIPGGLTAGLPRAEEIAELPPQDRRRAIRARELLQSWREQKDRTPIASLLARILDESGFEAALVCEFLGTRKLANVRKLVTMSRGFDRQGGFLLSDFVAQLRSHRDDPPREEQATTSDEEGASIRLMSIHQSKGLEFPIVVLPDLNRASEHRNRLVAVHSDLGLVVRPPLAEPGDDDSESDDGDEGVSLGWETCQALGREQDEQESLRLFYVAVTRGRDHLVLSSGYVADQGPRSVALRLLDERFDLQTGVCRARIPEDWPTPEISVADPAIATDVGLADRPALPSRRLSLDEIRETISLRLKQAEPLLARADPLEPSPTPASLIDLDRLDGLSPRARRIHRLIRSMIADRRLFQGKSLVSIATRAAARQFPAPHAGIVHDASKRLIAWIESESFLGFRSTPADAIRDGLGWTRMIDLRPGQSTVFRGSCDLLLHDPREGWMPLVVCQGDSELHRAASRLRLLLSGAVEPAAGSGPIRAGWLLALEEGRTELQREDRFDPDRVAAAASAFFSAFAVRDE